MGTQHIVGEVVPRAVAPRVLELVEKYARIAPDAGVLWRDFGGPLFVGFHGLWTADREDAVSRSTPGVGDKMDEAATRWHTLRTYLKANECDPGAGRNLTFECAEDGQMAPRAQEAP